MPRNDDRLLIQLNELCDRQNPNIEVTLVKCNTDAAKITKPKSEVPADTLPMVREHFEHHVGLLPRRVVGDQISTCKELLDGVSREFKAQRLCATTAMAQALADGGPPQSAEFVDAKTVKKWCDLQGKLLPLVEKYRQFQKVDALAVGLSTLWRSVSLGETSTQDAVKLLESAAALQTAAGAGDMPKASELFE